MITRKSNLYKHLSTSERLLPLLSGSKSIVGTLVSGRNYFENFRSGLGFYHICHVDRHGQFTLKQLILSPLNETHTNSDYRGGSRHLI